MKKAIALIALSLTATTAFAADITCQLSKNNTVLSTAEANYKDHAGSGALDASLSLTGANLLGFVTFLKADATGIVIFNVNDQISGKSYKSKSRTRGSFKDGYIEVTLEDGNQASISCDAS